MWSEMKTEQEIENRIAALDQGPAADELHTSGFLNGLRWVLGMFDHSEEDEE